MIVIKKIGLFQLRHIKFSRYLLPFWRQEAMILTLTGISTALGLVNPYLTKLIIDKAYKNKDLRLFIILVSAAGVIFILSGLLKGISNYLNSYIKLRIKFALNNRFFRKLQQLSYRYFQDTSSGEHLYKVHYDIEQVTQFIADLLPQFISLILKSLFIFLIILYMNRQMAFFSLVLTPFLYIGPYYFSRRLKKAFKIWIEDSQELFKKLQEVFLHIQLVKAFGKERSQVRGYIRGLIRNTRLRLANIRLEVASGFANNSVGRIVLGLVAFYGGYQVIRERMTLGSLSAILIYLGQLSVLQGSLAFFFQQIYQGIVSCERLDTILESKPEVVESKQAQEVVFLKGDIQFQNITFGYQSGSTTKDEKSQGKIILQNLSFNIPDGSCVALVGPSGCGKTTIINLLLRLYEPWQGGIFIQGHNIKDLKLKSLKGQLGVALQEPYLWNDTVENNIRYAKEDAQEQEIAEVAKFTGVDEFVQSLPGGYHTIIGENACKLSEGQKQRIAITRALLKKPKILILDEAMSSLDSLSEGKIIAQIKKIPQIQTIIIVSHRLSSVMACDLVYFLKGPSQMIMDKPQELIARDETFYNLFSAQIKDSSQKEMPFIQSAWPKDKC